MSSLDNQTVRLDTGSVIDGVTALEEDQQAPEDARGRSANRQPIRPPVTNIQGSILRFKQCRPWSQTAPNHFNADTFQRDAKRHKIDYKFEDVPIKTGSTYRNSGRTRSVTIKLAPTFEKNTFFVDPHTLHIYSCIHESVEKRLEQLGCHRAVVTHLTGPGDLVDLPKLAAAVDTDDDKNLLEADAPATVTLPRGQQPHLWKPDGKTSAENVVHAFDRKVFDSEKKIIFSPYRLWTKDARAKAGTKVTGMFTKYCQIYYAIKKLKPHEDPSKIELSMNALIKMAVDDIKQQKIMDPDWFQLATSIEK